MEELIGKKWYQSLTMWGLGLLGVVQGLESVGLVEPGTGILARDTATQAVEQGQGIASAIGELASQVGVLLAALGIRRAVK